MLETWRDQPGAIRGGLPSGLLLLILAVWLCLHGTVPVLAAPTGVEVEAASASHPHRSQDANRSVLIADTMSPTDTPGSSDFDGLDWYDAQTGRLRSPPLQPLKNPAAPQKWIWRPRNPNQANRSWRFPGIGDFAASVMEIILWVLVGGTLIWLIVYVLNAFQNFESTPSRKPHGNDDDDAIPMQRLAELPFSTGSSKTNLLEAAQQLYENGEFGKAMICLFGYQLLQLDRHHRIHLAKGKTNGQYLREVKKDVWLGSLLAETISTFEAHFFGDHPVSREQFESCWIRMDEFRHRLETSA